ncbi:MAG: hypothetical protein ABI592_11060 [Acidobacteriota bacterium]
MTRNATMSARRTAGRAAAAAAAAALVLASGTPASSATPVPRRPPAATPTPVPTPVPPPRIEPMRKGVLPRDRVTRFPSRDISFSRLLRVEEVDLDRDGVSEMLIDAIGSVQRLPEGVPAVGFVSRYRLPFESPLLAVMKKNGNEWSPLFVAHVPLRCGQSDDLSTCDQLLRFHSIRFRFDDRPQIIFQMLHAGDSGLNETYSYRLAKGKLETTFSVALPRASVNVSIDPNGIERRLAVDTFVNRDLPTRYRSFTLRTGFVFGENRFRIASDTPEEPWSADRSETELAYWGLVHQTTFGADVEKLRERQKSIDAWLLDPVEVIRHRYPDATRVRLGARMSGVCVVFFERPNNCHAHALLYQPAREWEGDKTFWEIGAMRGQKDPYECLEESPLEVNR